MSLISPVFEQHYKAYLSQLAALDFQALAQDLGVRLTTSPDGPCMELVYFNRAYNISPAGITDGSGRTPGYDTCIVLCRYLIMAGERAGQPHPFGAGPANPGGINWAGFRDLKDAGPLIVYFRDNVETAIATTLSGRISRSLKILEPLNPSRPDMDLHYDLAVKVDALPRIPLLVLANDAEDGFPATCSVLFESRVETFLDAECIAMAGYRLARILGKLFS